MTPDTVRNGNGLQLKLVLKNISTAATPGKETADALKAYDVSVAMVSLLRHDCRSMIEDKEEALWFQVLNAAAPLDQQSVLPERLKEGVSSLARLKLIQLGLQE